MFVWLPAEYSIDPTRVGGLLGLTEMGEIKQQLYAEAAAEDAALAAQSAQIPPPGTDPQLLQRPPAPPAGPAAPAWRDEVSYTLAPTEGIEGKLVMAEGDVAQFEWTANGSVLNQDTDDAGGGNSVTYEQGRGVPAQEGEPEAAFAGNHGWFWRNRTDAPVTFTLRTRGAYSEMKAP